MHRCYWIHQNYNNFWMAKQVISLDWRENDSYRSILRWQNNPFAAHKHCHPYLWIGSVFNRVLLGMILVISKWKNLVQFIKWKYDRTSSISKRRALLKELFLCDVMHAKSTTRRRWLYAWHIRQSQLIDSSLAAVPMEKPKCYFVFRPCHIIVVFDGDWPTQKIKKNYKKNKRWTNESLLFLQQSYFVVAVVRNAKTSFFESAAKKKKKEQIISLRNKCTLHCREERRKKPHTLHTYKTVISSSTFH